MTAARFVNESPVTHAIDDLEDRIGYAWTKCDRRIDWLDNGFRSQRRGYRVEDPIDCMTCLVRE